MAWRVARSLGVLLSEIEAVAPGRNRAADGAIGDAAHAARTSDHNPWVKDSTGLGVVRARDFTHDPAGGLDCSELAELLASELGRHPALGSGAYVIWDGRIISTDRRGEGWRPYTGSNPHNHHLHVSVALAQSGYDSPAAWGWEEKEDEMNPAQEKKLDALGDEMKAVRKDLDELADREKKRAEQARTQRSRVVKLVKEKATTEDILAALAEGDDQ